MELDNAPQPAQGLFEGERRMAQEQIAAAWQLHVEAMQDQMERGWREHVERALDDRFTSLEATFEQELEARVSARVAEEHERAICGALRMFSERLNQTARRLEQAESTDGWAAALLDGAFAVAPRVLLFSVIGGELQYEDHRSMGELQLDELGERRIPLTEAAAFGGVIESLDAVIAMATPGEISQTLADALGGAEEKRVFLLPILVGQSEGKRRVAAVLYAEGGGELVDINLLEVIAALAGMTLDSRHAVQRAAPAAPAGAVLSIVPATGGSAVARPAPASLSWSELPRDEQELHARAQRFARVRVAEMRLYQAQAVRKGREQGNLYAALRGEMDRGRAQFKHEFMTTASMVDYFHVEVVRTLANEDAALMGEEYPGPLA
ncbi:MAG: hypothetical protein HY821_06925 [Acidobacteria bacterium]|nr:hypothetical protein [Acidobacteriota bacterium]